MNTAGLQIQRSREGGITIQKILCKGCPKTLQDSIVIGTYYMKSKDSTSLKGTPFEKYSKQ